jgi:GntR family transcriptional regulator
MTDQADALIPEALSFENSSPVPKYHQLREILRENISNWGPNQPIPSEAQLCEMFSVSRTTVRKALDHLTYEGLLYRVQGKGTYVSPPKLPGRYVQRLLGFYEDMVARGLPHKTVVLEQGVEPASYRIANFLNIQLGEEIFRLVRLRYIGEEACLISKSHVPMHFLPGINREDFSNQSLYGVMRDKYGVIIHHGKRLIEVQLCTEEEAELLEIPSGSPLLVVIGTMYNQENQPVEYGYAKNRADRIQMEIQVFTQELP